MISLGGRSIVIPEDLQVGSPRRREGIRKREALLSENEKRQLGGMGKWDASYMSLWVPSCLYISLNISLQWTHSVNPTWMIPHFPTAPLVRKRVSQVYQVYTSINRNVNESTHVMPLPASSAVNYIPMINRQNGKSYWIFSCMKA